MIPTVGRVVHYTNLGDADGKYPPEQQAAIITRVVKKETTLGEPHEENLFKVSLCVFYSTGQFWMPEVRFSEQYERGHWTWPPRV